MEKAWKFIQTLIEKTPKQAVFAFAGIGLLSILNRALTPLGDFWRLRCTGIPNYAQLYGGTHVLITGASDGIGEVLAYEFAKMGFKLVLVGRNEDKLNKVKEKCVITLKTEVICIVEDLATRDRAVFERIAAAVRDLDISILINNAGVISYFPFAKQSQADVNSLIEVNCVSHTLLTHMLLPKLLSRSRKSLIINTASISGFVPAGYIAVYSATKAYMRFFSLSLRNEVKGKIDVFSANPGRVKTKMVVAAEKMVSVTSIDTTVSGILREAPRQAESFCSITHAWLHFRLSSDPLERVVASWTPSAKLQYEEIKSST